MRFCTHTCWFLQVMFQCKLCCGLHKTKEDLLTHYGVLHCDDSLQYQVILQGSEEAEQDDDDVSDPNMEAEVELSEEGASQDDNGKILLDLRRIFFYCIF